MKKSLFSLVMIATFLSQPVWAQTCEKLFPETTPILAVDKKEPVKLLVNSEAQVVQANIMIEQGIDPIIAARVTAFYPHLAKKILEKIDKNELEMITIYRGVSVEIEQHNPFHIRYTPGGNFVAPPLRIGVNNGIFGSKNVRDAIAYTSGLMYAKQVSKQGVVFELQIPRFLVTQHWLHKDYMYISRSNTPELDLWVTKYTHAGIKEFMSKEKLNLNWQDFGDFYLSEKRQDMKAKSIVDQKFVGFFNIIGKLKSL